MNVHPLGTVLVTGAGGPAAVTVLQSLADHARLIAADIDPVAVGLYLVPAAQRVLLPRGDDPGFAEALLAAAVRHGVDVVVPTVDTELRSVSAARAVFAEHGIDVLVEQLATLDLCLDKAVLVERCGTAVRVPRTIVVGRATSSPDVEALGLPFVVKPRSGAGGRGVAVLGSPADLETVPHDGTYLAQEMLPGAEYSIDVLARPDGRVVAAVPRRRDKVDSGVAVAGRTVADPALERFGRVVATLIGATGVVNVQAKLDRNGEPGLLEVNARFPGTMSLTRAAGVDMPLLAVRALRGLPIPDQLPFREVAAVRHWSEVLVTVEEYSDVHELPSVSDGTLLAAR